MIYIEETPVDERVTRCRENAGAAMEDAQQYPEARADFVAIAHFWVRMSLEIQAALRRGETPPDISKLPSLRQNGKPA
jgi:hypothetical protein